MVLLPPHGDAMPTHPIHRSLPPAAQNWQASAILVHVEKLDRTDSLALLRHHAGVLSDEFSDQVCDALGDHPLAIEIMGQHLRRYPDDEAAAFDRLGEAHRARS